MRILFSQTVPYLPHEFGGGLTNTDALCRALIARRHEVMVLCRDLRSGLTRLMPWARKVDLGYPVTRVDDPLGAVRDVCQSYRPDLAVVQFGDIAGMVAALKSADIPVLAYLHDTGTVAQVKGGADAYAACSSSVAAALRNIDIEATVLPVLIDPASYRVPAPGNLITFVNPIPRKGIEIAFELAARRPEIGFQFVEAWHLRARVRKYLQQRIAHHGNIQLRPPVRDMRQIYANTRLVLAPSLWEEAWGRVISEAQVSGIPALVSDSGGMPEAVGAGGIVVARDAPIGEWAAALDKLWFDEEFYRKTSKLALDHAARPEFSVDAIADRFLNLIQGHATRR
ncbi:glycosyltransferase [Rhodopseudomonas palustris]|nr:glycosyltransferase [Rhodopseudomonas palustris]